MAQYNFQRKTVFVKKKTGKNILEKKMFRNKNIDNENFPHRTVILNGYFENIPLKSCNIAKIFIKLLERFLKYCRNLPMSIQNIIN